MARSGNFSFLAFLLIAGRVAAVLSVAQADYKAVPVPEPEAAEAESYLARCAAKLTEKCGEVIFGNIFLEQNQLTPECCEKLVLMGRECHDAMASFIMSLPAFSKNATVTVPRSKLAWHKCVLLAEEALSPASEGPGFAGFD
ncbi:protein DOWN-REGULATED IN DIF1 11-like [Rhodamnia argentea]|uniref:Protein DOWN-REGULATED IN DIF1 11-like n=1 Tax=Rhodamnia argentea TaxID=178133 RepID=A0A8B8PMT6_9MYRT|nr:protein DOWN-REGULATED IN DIF1 11-like [Rhodamnia argentea]